MSRKKLIMAVIVLTIALSGIGLSILLFSKENEVNPLVKVTATASPGATASPHSIEKSSLTATSYEQIYNQVLLAKLKDYIQGGTKDDMVAEDA